MKHFLVLFLFSFLSFSSISQSKELTYFKLANTADSLYYLGEYKESLSYYQKSLKVNVDEKFKFIKWYNIAVASAETHQNGSAFVYLNKIFSPDNPYKYLYQITYDELLEDSSFIHLHSTHEWKKLLIDVKINNETITSEIDSNLILLVEKLNKSDRFWRGKYFSVSQEFGKDSQEALDVSLEMKKSDSINASIGDSIINIYGWPGIDKLGFNGHFQFFTIIQHADIEHQIKHLPLLRKEVIKHKATSGCISLLEDRIHMMENGTQLYGTQYCQDLISNEYYLCPIEDPNNLNRRRFSLFLLPFEMEAKQKRIDWNLKEYLIKLPEHKAIYNRDHKTINNLKK